jgi:purine-binding chemotaxis protein CheW
VIARVGVELPAEAHAALPAARACTVALAGYRFAVEVRFAREVVVLDKCTPVPLAPAHLLGVANLRGSIMPLVDVRPLLGMTPAAPGREIRALVVECDGVQMSLLIDEVLGLEPLDGLARSAQIGDVIAGCSEREGIVVTLLDVHALLAAVAVESRVEEVR